MTSIYLASPYKIGDKLANVKRQHEVANLLIIAGYYPHVPLNSHYQDENFPQTEEVWLNQDKYWLGKCDYLLRLPGESAGADKEVTWARELDIPVYFDIIELMKYLLQKPKTFPIRFRDIGE